MLKIVFISRSRLYFCGRELRIFIIISFHSLPWIRSTICLRRLFKRRRKKPIKVSSVKGFLIFLCLYLFFFLWSTLGILWSVPSHCTRLSLVSKASKRQNLLSKRLHPLERNDEAQNLLYLIFPYFSRVTSRSDHPVIWIYLALGTNLCYFKEKPGKVPTWFHISIKCLHVEVNYSSNFVI